MRRFLLAIIAVELVVVGVTLLLWAYPPSAMVALALAGRSPYCATADVWKGADRRVFLNAEIERLTAGSTLIDEDPAGYELWSTPMGDYWVPRGSGASLPVLLAQQSVDNYGDVEVGVREGDVVLDGGAHVGVYVREALDRGARLVVAIEPAPANVECLRRNFPEEIADGRVIVYAKGIWDEEDELPFFQDPDNSAADGFLLKTESFESRHVIALTTIDNLVAELSLDHVDVIKMDIKGAALRALTGGQQTLAADRPRVIISTEEDSDNPDELLTALESFSPGYRSACTSSSIVMGWSLSPDVLVLTPPLAPSRAALN
jgi:FkbM family methyltransferase